MIGRRRVSGRFCGPTHCFSSFIYPPTSNRTFFRKSTSCLQKRSRIRFSLYSKVRKKVHLRARAGLSYNFTWCSRRATEAGAGGPQVQEPTRPHHYRSTSPQWTYYTGSTGRDYGPVRATSPDRVYIPGQLVDIMDRSGQLARVPILYTGSTSPHRGEAQGEGSR